MAIHIDEDGNFYFGATGSTDFDSISYIPDFYVTKDGVIRAVSGQIGGWELASNYLRSENSSGQFIYLNNNGTIAGNYTQGSAGWIIEADGSAEFNDVTVRGELTGVELSGTLDFNGGTFRTSGSTPRIEITDNSQLEGEIRYETSSGTAMRLAVESTSPTDFFIENGILNGDTRVITSSGGTISLEGDTLNLTNGASNNDPILTFNGINAASKTSTTLSKLIGVTSTGRLAVGSATSGVSSISGTGDIAVTGSSGVLNIHHDDSDHDFADTSHNHDGEYVDTVSGSTDALTISGRNITLNFGNTGTRVAAGNHDHDGDYAAPAHGTHVSSSTAVTALFPGGLRGIVTFSAGTGGRWFNGISQSGQTITYNSTTTGGTNYASGFHPTATGSGLGLSYRGWGIWYNTINQASDERKKENIIDIPVGLDWINSLQPKQFDYSSRTVYVCGNGVCDLEHQNADDICEDCYDDETETSCTLVEKEVLWGNDLTNYGFIAQDIEAVTPNHADLEIVKDDEDGYKGMNYTQLIAPLVKAVQELSTQISDLTARVEALEG